MKRFLPLALCAVFALSACDSSTVDTAESDRVAAAGTTASASPAAAEADAADRDPSDAEPDSALRMLYTLDVKGRAPKTGYDRDGFGWRDDVDHNGCDTRNDVLRRDLTDITLADDGCVVLGGALTSAYSGDTFDFIRGDGNNVDIDHVVALSNAWQTGAQQLSDAERRELANDPLNLLAVESSLNRQKGDADAATWLPPERGYRCEYVSRQIRVKHEYDLWVTRPEFETMEELLLGCEEPAFDDDSEWPDRYEGDVDDTDTSRTGSGASGSSSSGSGSTGSGSSSSGPSSPGSSGSGGSHTGGAGSAPDSGGGASGAASGPFENCDAARAAGAAPVHAGDPGYGRHLDRDGDGVGCE
ncbi:GmrSD restriction endonuclease domain-containing protein [Brevibacterium salitolerans]|uniref:DUF1524 domain-containing protein n=1 Tax=Brevibacterium salitolerans TaxID=1403566 RepID=A0ABP5HVU0_9MICO